RLSNSNTCTQKKGRMQCALFVCVTTAMKRNETQMMQMNIKQQELLHPIDYLKTIEVEVSSLLN
ncbi:MAG: hypothetical protein Q8R54_00325, partial [Methylobacter sp.]|nr:hypothetical protein [Methylobacter sp.]